MSLRQLIYASKPTDSFVPEDLDRILQASRRNNHEIGVTGLLLFTGDFFTQVLEGKPQRIEALYKRISKDPRHLEIKLVSDTGISTRHFGNWDMAYLHTSFQEIEDTIGLKMTLDMGQFLAKITDDEHYLSKLIAGYSDRLKSEPQQGEQQEGS